MTITKPWPFRFAPLFALAFLWFIPGLQAQPATGIIEGRISNPATGEYLERARITVEGTALETFSDSDGNYREPRERAVLYVDGRLDRIIENASDPCAGAVYAAFPELEKMVR